MKNIQNSCRRWAVSLAAVAAISMAAPASSQSSGSTADQAYDIGKWVIPNGVLVDLAIDKISKPKQVKRYTDPACKVENPICGAIVYANAGGYTVSSVSLNAKSAQPFGVPPIHESCADVDVKLKADVKLNTYDTFIVPADCLYKLEINIAGGPRKDRDVFLTPGCQAQTYTDGTTQQNSWSKKLKWISGAKPDGASNDPADPLGNKCSVS